MIHQRGLTKKTELTIREFECVTLFHLYPGQSDKYFGSDIKEQWKPAAASNDRDGRQPVPNSEDVRRENGAQRLM
jgi:hypothetical protein